MADDSKTLGRFCLMGLYAIAADPKTLGRFWTTELLWVNGPRAIAGWSKNPMPLLNHRAMTRSGPKAA